MRRQIVVFHSFSLGRATASCMRRRQAWWDVACCILKRQAAPSVLQQLKAGKKPNLRTPRFMDRCMAREAGLRHCHQSSTRVRKQECRSDLGRYSTCDIGRWGEVGVSVFAANGMTAEISRLFLDIYMLVHASTLVMRVKAQTGLISYELLWATDTKTEDSGPKSQPSGPATILILRHSWCPVPRLISDKTQDSRDPTDVQSARLSKFSTKLAVSIPLGRSPHRHPKLRKWLHKFASFGVDSPANDVSCSKPMMGPWCTWRACCNAHSRSVGVLLVQ